MSIFKKHSAGSRVKRAEKLKKGKTNEEAREIEQQLLRPAELPKYAGPTPKHRSEIESRTVLIVFKNKAQQDLIGGLFDIRTSKVTGESYITDISLLDTIARQVQAGELVVTEDGIQVNTERTQADGE